ncbi:MAG: hypothetical protein AAGJ56_07905, partial [Myxococcota bacterium]
VASMAYPGKNVVSSNRIHGRSDGLVEDVASECLESANISFILDHARSMGFHSGEYGGRNSALAPAE